MTVLVTGATGFVGTALLERILRDASSDGRPTIRATTRLAAQTFGSGVESLHVPDIVSYRNWPSALEGVKSVVHLAARVHVMRESQAQAADLYIPINVDATLQLARDAARCGVGRFVFLSSIKVLGERTDPGQAWNEQSPLRTSDDAYAQSKIHAEQALRQIGEETGLEIVIVRPPLVYGPGVGANFRALMRMIARGVPLPLAAINNRRSLVGVENLADFLMLCTTHPAAANQTFVISDGDDLSTPELVRRIARAQGRQARLFAVAPVVVMSAARALGLHGAAQRLIDSLQIDKVKASALLSWIPPVSVDEQLRRTVRAERDVGSPWPGRSS